MAEKTFIVKLAGDSKSYQSSMDQASKALNKYQKANLSTDAAVKTLSSALTKFVSVAAVVKGAQEVITRTMQGTQKTADEWAATMDGCKNAVDTFFTALSKGDFSSFTGGLVNIIAKGREASQALDQLGNTVMSFNYLSSSSNTQFSEALLTMKDVNATPAQRAAAQKEAEQQLKFMEDITAGKKASLYKAIRTSSTKKSPLSSGDFRVEDIRQIALLDAFADTPEMLAQYGLQDKQYYLNQAAEYARRIKEAMPKYETYDGNLARSEQGRQQIAEIEARNATARANFQAFEQTLKNEYRFALEVQALLEDISDEQLQEILSLNEQIFQSDQNLIALTKQLKMAKGEFKRGLSTEEETAPLPMTTNLPAAAGIALMDVTGPNLPDKLPETVENLEDTDVVLARIAENANAAADGFDRMAAASEGFNSLGRAAEYMGQALAQSDSKGWKAAGSIVASVGAAVQAYTQLSQAAAQAAAAQAMAETPTVWGKIAALTMLVTAFTNAASQLRSGIQSFAEGGVVSGQNFRDGITARVSSGEMIINEADQRRLYDSIHNGNAGGGGGPAVVTGEQIVLAVNSYGRRSNRGELVFAGKG